MRFRFAANPARVRTPICPRRASNRPSGCPTRWRGSRSRGWSAARSVRSVQTAQPVADALGLTVEIDERLAEYDRDLAHYIPIEQIAAEFPEELAAAGRAAPAQQRRRDRLPGADQRGDPRHRSAAGDHEDTVAVFSHGGVINGLLHTILGTEKILCVQRRLRGRHPAAVLARGQPRMWPRSTAPSTYGTCCREIGDERSREEQNAADGRQVR